LKVTHKAESMALCPDKTERADDMSDDERKREQALWEEKMS
jgi:hypothetical protein